MFKHIFENDEHLTIGLPNWPSSLDRRLSRSELELQGIVCPWSEEDDVIYFDVVSDGLPGEECIQWLDSNGYHVGDNAKQLFRSPEYRPTKGVTTKVAVIYGTFWKQDKDRFDRNIRKEATDRKWETPNAELGYLIRRKFTDEQLKQMGLWCIVVMHEHIKDPDGCTHLLSVSRVNEGRLLAANFSHANTYWHDYEGFAFSVEQASS